MIGLLVAATVSPAAPEWHREGRFPAPEVAVERISGCGMGRPEASYDDTIQDAVLRFPEETQASEEQLFCAAQASFDTGYYVDLPEPLAARYWQQYKRVSGPWGEELSREWLAKEGLLEGLPRFEGSGLSDAEFASLLESRCGSGAVGMLSSSYGPHTLSPDIAALMLDESSREQTAKAMLCISASGTAAGYDVYFMGNGKMAE